MNLKISQSYEYVGNDYWHWKVWLDGSETELMQVASVTWYLHPSFSPSVISVKNRKSRFELEQRGWGTFLIRATVLREDGEEIKLRHKLELYYPDESSTEAERGRAPTSASIEQSAGPKGTSPRQVFISYGSEDRIQADHIRQAIESLGARVVDPAGISAGDPWQSAISKMLRESDAMVAVVSSEFPSPFLAEEVTAAVRSGKPTLVIANKDIGRVVGFPEAVQIQHIAGSDAKDIAGSLGEWVKQLTSSQ
jgi:transcription initiation factor IIF auxiliary subunit